MRTDTNWIETRFLSENVAEFLGKSTEEVEEILKTCENFLIHRFLEIYLNDETHKDKDYAIELPYIGTFVVSFTTEVSRTFNFVPRQAFLFKLKKAYNQKESPLTKQLTKNLENKLVTEYRAERGEL